MEIAHIKEFLVLAEICNYGRAADLLFISQSSLFNHIKSLEAEIGEPLFNKKGKSIVLSDYGQIFVPYAKNIVSALKDYQTAVNETKQFDTQTVRVCSQYRITDLVRSFRREYPYDSLHILDSYDAIDALDEGSCELAFIRDIDPVKNSVYHILPYYTDNIVLAVYAGHPLAKRSSVAFEEIRSEDFVMISHHQEQECYGMRLCKQNGFIPQVVMTAANGNEAAQLVNDEAGISLFLKQTLISENFNNIVLIDMVPAVECRISLCWRKDIKLSDGASHLVEYVRDHYTVPGSAAE